MLSEISIKQVSRDFLYRLFADQPEDMDHLVELIDRFHPRSTNHPNTLFAEFSGSELEVILDALADRFVSIGLREDHEPNPLGVMI